MIQIKSWQTTVVPIVGGVVTEVTFKDTIPNTAQFRNNGNSNIYMNSNSQIFDIAKNKYEFMIAAGATRVYVNPAGFRKLFLYSPSDTDIIINSLYDDGLRAYDLDETGVVMIDTVNVAPAVEVTKISAPLPAGDNNIGNVDVVSLPVLPAGDNNIGNVDVNSLPSIPAGDKHIGDLSVDEFKGTAYVMINAILQGIIDNNSGLPALKLGLNNILDALIPEMQDIQQSILNINNLTLGDIYNRLISVETYLSSSSDKYDTMIGLLTDIKTNTTPA